MPLYGYRGYSASGKTTAGVVDAEDQAAARRSLKDRGIFLTGPLEETRRESASLITAWRWRAAPRLADLALFTYQWKTLLASGLPMIDALTVLVNEQSTGTLKVVLAGVRDRVRDGMAIAPALARSPEVFNDLYVNMVAAGDAGGMLEDALDHLATHLERQERVSGRIRAAMTYPAFMTAIGFVILSYLLTSVVPKVVVIFKDVGRALPLPTVILVSFSTLLANHWPVILIALAAAWYAGYRFFSTATGRTVLEQTLDHLPYIGATLHAMRTARFGRTMEALLKGGVPLSTSLAIASSAAGHSRLAAVLSNAHEAVQEGRSVSGSLRESAFFPESTLSLVTVGETGGNLEESFARIGDAKEKELDRRLETLLTLLEPTMILVMGAIVGFIVFAILLPVLEMSHLR